MITFEFNIGQIVKNVKKGFGKKLQKQVIHINYFKTNSLS